MTMSESSPEPPIPPPLAPALCLLNSNEDSVTDKRYSLEGNDDDDDEVEINFLYELDVFVEKAVTKVKSVLQSGPNCGIAALSMVCLLTSTPPTIDYIMNEAKRRGFTINGEMFSADNMKLLAESLLAPWYHVEILTNGLKINQEEVIHRLLNGDLMLIPYDADKNHSPCCLRGHKAHWALACGALRDSNGIWYVAARQGKSRRLHVWRFHSLALSNENLSELDPSREADGLTYVLPPEGLKEGLASKFIMLKRRFGEWIVPCNG